MPHESGLIAKFGLLPITMDTSVIPYISLICGKKKGRPLVFEFTEKHRFGSCGSKSCSVNAYGCFWLVFKFLEFVIS